MSKPAISLLGATYSDVSGVQLPVSGGGTALFPFVEGSETKTENGTYDVTTLAQLIVNVSGGGGLEYETGTYKPSTDISRPTISFAKTHSKPPVIIVFADGSETPANISTYTGISFIFADVYKLFGKGAPRSISEIGYSIYLFGRRGSGTSMVYGGSMTTYSSDDTGDSSNAYSRYFATESNFKPYGGSSSYYWRATQTYNWIAVWK